MAYRFIHTADIHLDSPLKSLAMRNKELADVVANATRQTFVRIVDLCLSEKVDALLIAGDLYDGDQTSMKTARFLASQLRRLDAVGINVFIIRGNHDAESKITRELTLPDCVHVFGNKAGAVIVQPNDDQADALARAVVIHGASFKQPHAPDSLLPLFKQPDPSAINIGMMHTSLDGASGHDLYAPCALTDLQEHGFDYWALGHIHKRCVYQSSECTVVMPGIPQGRDIGESGVKSVTLVVAGDDGRIETEEHVLAVAQFDVVEVDMSNLQDWAQAIKFVMNAIDSAFESCDAEHLVARVVLKGVTTLGWQLRRDSDLFKQEITSRLEDDSQRWLDKLIVDCEPAAVDLQAGMPETSNSFQELHELMTDEINNSAAFRNDAKLAVENLIGLLPAELRASFGENEEALENKMRVLALEGAVQVTATMQPNGSNDAPVALSDKQVQD